MRLESDGEAIQIRVITLLFFWPPLEPGAGGNVVTARECGRGLIHLFSPFNLAHFHPPSLSFLSSFILPHHLAHVLSSSTTTPLQNAPSHLSLPAQ